MSLASGLRVVRKFSLVLLVLVLLGGVAWGVWVWRRMSNAPPSFRTEKVTRGKLVATINASGTLVPEETIDVGAQVAGQIVRFGPSLEDSGKPVDYCSRVKAGSVLAIIDPALYESEVTIATGNLLSAEGQVNKAEQDLASAKLNVKAADANLASAIATQRQASKDVADARKQMRAAPNSVTRLEFNGLVKALDTANESVKMNRATLGSVKAAVLGAEASLLVAKGNVKTAQGNLDKAKKNLAYTVIKSPVDGLIVDRRVNIGQTVVASLSAPSLFLIAKDLKRMNVWVTVNEADIGRIRPGQLAYFKVDAHPQDVFSGTVAQIRLNAAMTQNVVTYTVVVTTDNENLKLLPYLTANLQFRVDQRTDVPLIPNSALRYRPAPERVHPDFRTAYEQSRRRRAIASVIAPEKDRRKQGRATVWVEEDGFVRPVRIRTGLTDGIHTEVAEVLEGTLEEGTEVVTGEVQNRGGSGGSPFTPKLFQKKPS
jgi:HlyD family secretion protein